MSCTSCCADVHVGFLQAYGDAVVEEAPIFAISNYEVTFFCRRHLTDVRDKRIWASPPIAWDSASLPPRAAWLHFLGVAQECRNLMSKTTLLRDEVPSAITPGFAVASPSREDGRLIASLPTGVQTVDTCQQSARRAKHAAEGRVAQASSMEMAAPSSGLTDCPQMALSLWLRSLQELPIEDAIFELPCVEPNDELRLTMECLGSTSLARVMKVGHVKFVTVANHSIDLDVLCTYDLLSSFI